MAADLTLYQAPDEGEWNRSKDLAKIVAATEFVPTKMRGKPAAVLACVMTGRELGIGPMQALKHIAIIEGKAGLSAELMAALIRSRGHKLRVIEWTEERATVEGVRADDPDATLRVTWTLERAERAKLCKIVDGRPVARDSQGRPKPWELYSEALLLARATSTLGRALFADVLAGCSYTPEELDASDGGGDPSTMVTVGSPEPAPAFDLETGEVLGVEEPATNGDGYTATALRAAQEQAQEARKTSVAGDGSGEGPSPATAPPTATAPPMRDVLKDLRTSATHVAQILVAAKPEIFSDITPREVLDLDGEDRDVAVTFLYEQRDQEREAASA